mmetsp:Transcript_9455/g.14176  ORF Transcript_9455/g.14176 Transcript_9455/m.14176 type:complete len:303 (-) Transcript_9455:138-1046(-)|eukprot:CAMPEP_0167753230 /NCGR_PEP_ID=MMETSP0110_2-20121227/7592_1 /TAXON_ID=629695 /ORGANISM="Gymnochlora sp., Strain CCMP2014" /LENGTH=302 /DNA_ID=CAMNT_0007638961 /DNA_START=91 /DNA_END=999 /DNA_ORIENTATION=+
MSDNAEIVVCRTQSHTSESSWRQGIQDYRELTSQSPSTTPSSLRFSGSSDVSSIPREIPFVHSFNHLLTGGMVHGSSNFEPNPALNISSGRLSSSFLGIPFPFPRVSTGVPSPRPTIVQQSTHRHTSYISSPEASMHSRRSRRELHQRGRYFSRSRSRSPGSSDSSQTSSSSDESSSSSRRTSRSRLRYSRRSYRRRSRSPSSSSTSRRSSSSSENSSDSEKSDVNYSFRQDYTRFNREGCSEANREANNVVMSTNIPSSSQQRPVVSDNRNNTQTYERRIIIEFVPSLSISCLATVRIGDA